MESSKSKTQWYIKTHILEPQSILFSEIGSSVALETKHLTGISNKIFVFLICQSALSESSRHSERKLYDGIFVQFIAQRRI